MSWPVLVLDAPASTMSISARAPGEPPLNEQFRAPIRPAVPPSAPRDSGVALLREYLDPDTGQSIDVARLAPGQLVRARLTIVAMATQRQLVVEDQLPAGAALVAVGAGGDFERATAEADRVVLEREVAQPGIYQHSYLLRFVAVGRFGVPAPVARAAGGEGGVGNAMLVEVRQTP